MRYKCVVLDHDDTVVASTASLHFPSFQKSLKLLKPEIEITVEDYFLYNFHPGFIPFCEDILGLTQEEIEFQNQRWQKDVSLCIPCAYDGFKDILWELKRQGVLICVASHSMKKNILRDYQANGLPKPDMVFGWDEEPQNRKPSPYALKQIMKTFHLQASDLVMIDDLKPGKDMADCCGVDFIGAGWAHDIADIKNYMKENCDVYFESVDELGRYLLEI